MKIIQLIERSDIEQYTKAKKRFYALKELLDDLRGRELDEEVINLINLEIDRINKFSGSVKILASELRLITGRILAKLKKEHKLVKKNHYRDLWMALGLSVYGLPLGVVLGAALDNMGLISNGVVLGMVLGLALGSGMDKKAEREGRVLLQR